MLSLRSHGGKGKVGKGEGAQLIARLERAARLASERARGGAAPTIQFRRGFGKPFSSKPSTKGRLAMHLHGGGLGQCEWTISPTLSISRSLHRAGLRGTVDLHSSIRADRVFVPTPGPSIARPGAFCLCIRESCRRVSSTGRRKKRVDSQKPAVSNFGKSIRAGATHGGAGTAAGRWWCWSDTGRGGGA